VCIHMCDSWHIMCQFGDNSIVYLASYIFSYIFPYKYIYHMDDTACHAKQIIHCKRCDNILYRIEHHMMSHVREYQVQTVI
jgi:hypothetical protein